MPNYIPSLTTPLSTMTKHLRRSTTPHGTARRWLTIGYSALVIAMATVASPLRAAETKLPRLETNQEWVESLLKSPSLKVESVDAALDFVFQRLPDEVFVYPTENYYYFRFASGGLMYAGNLRLAAQDRDTGIIHFAYFIDANAANDSGDMNYKALGKSDGVVVEKVTPFKYRVTYKSKSVVFQLNELRDAKPPADIVAKGETYIGPIFDESGIRFFLFYNESQKVFAYVLDETAPVQDQLTEIEKDSRILIGQRSGFAFYKHHHLNRKVLIGVHGGNTIVNNYYDGPADQLPENFLKGDNLKRAIEASDASVVGKLDQFGYIDSGEGRYLIAPYAQYTDVSELEGYDTCARDHAKSPDVYDGCFISADDSE